MMIDRLHAMSKKQQAVQAENERKAVKEIVCGVVAVVVGVLVVYGCMWLGCAMDYATQIN